MTKHTPATPLPWQHGKDRSGRIRIFGPDGIECVRALWKCVKTKEQRDANRAYIAHAANAYPKLVEAARYLAAMVEDINERHAQQGRVMVQELLRSLGEDA
jgi:hypothetical protein